MPNLLVKEIEKAYLKTDLPDLSSGDSVKVKIKIKEGDKFRFQNYEGIVIRVKGEGTSKTVTVRRVFQGVGIERTFLIHSPLIANFEILRKGMVSRSRLYYLRERFGKSARVKQQRQ